MKKKLCAVLSFVILICSLLPLSVNARSLPTGDMNHDGLVNNKDVVALFKYVSGDAEAVTVTDALDFNNDGAVNNKDVTALFKAVST